MFNLVGRLIGTWPRAIYSRSSDMAPMEVVPEITHSRVLCALRFVSFTSTYLLHPLSLIALISSAAFRPRMPITPRSMVFLLSAFDIFRTAGLQSRSALPQARD
jgi:hypothetical protein